VTNGAASPRGGKDLDFGIAKVRDAAGRVKGNKTRNGVLIGSPERTEHGGRYKNAKDSFELCDLWSAGVMMPTDAPGSVAFARANRVTRGPAAVSTPRRRRSRRSDSSSRALVFVQIRDAEGFA